MVAAAGGFPTPIGLTGSVTECIIGPSGASDLSERDVANGNGTVFGVRRKELESSEGVDPHVSAGER